MAHVGRNYLLHMRRDLCLGCTNYKDAWPDAWLMGGRIALSAPTQPPVNFDGLICPPLDPEDKDLLAWQSDFITTGGRTFRLRITFHAYLFEQEQQQVKIAFRDANHQVAHRIARMELPRQCGNISIGFGAEKELTVDDPEWWGGSTLRSTVAGVAARWSHWPTA